MRENSGVAHFKLVEYAIRIVSFGGVKNNHPSLLHDNIDERRTRRGEQSAAAVVPVHAQLSLFAPA